MKLGQGVQVEIVKVAAIGLGAAVAIFLVYRGVKAGAGAVVSAVADAAPYVNPIDSRNVAYSSVNAVGNVIASDPESVGKNADGSWSLGGAIFDLTHANPVTSKWWWQK